MEPATGIRRRGRFRRGLTFIETVCAVALLGLVTATTFAAFNSIMGTQRRQQQRLDAMELANRLILEYLDDKETMPAAGLPIVYNDTRYRWDLREIPVRLEPARPDVAEERSMASPISVDRMQAIVVRVWLGEESGGSFSYDTTVPAVSLTRLMDPIALRNPDTTKRLANNPAKQAELLDRFRNVGRNTGAGRTRRPAQPQPAGNQRGTR